MEETLTTDEMCLDCSSHLTNKKMSKHFLVTVGNRTKPIEFEGYVTEGVLSQVFSL